MVEMMKNRHVNCGDLRTIISYHYEPDEDYPDYGYYVIEIQVVNGSRIIRKERLVSDNLNILDEDMKDEER